jgi:DNA-binding CsgD family transcriptional regulator
VASWLGAALTSGVDLTNLQKEAEVISEGLSVLTAGSHGYSLETLMKMTANACERQQTKSSKAMSVFVSESHGIKTGDDVPAFEGEPAHGDLEGLEALGLTRRQAEVAFWIAQGKTNDDLAIILNTSRHTIPHHVEAILGRLQLATRAEIMLCALEALGWLRWPAKRREKSATNSRKG